jgi:glycosyltransferase involved in cell wall biosynthesis
LSLSADKETIATLFRQRFHLWNDFIMETEHEFDKYSSRYTALIRTLNSESTIASTIYSLESQTEPPNFFIIVDSGSTDGTLSLLPENSKVHHYSSKEFNFSEAINQGIPYACDPYILIISSHTAIIRKEAMAYAIRLLQSHEEIGAAYFCAEENQELTHKLIGLENFDGFNGVWNTCALFRSSLLRKRPFRPEVFSAEDQEWSKWLFESEGKFVARLSGGRVSFNNPRKNLPRKRLNEYVAVASFVRPQMLKFPYLARVIYRIIRPVSKFSERKFNIYLLINLLLRRFYGKKFKSRYF